MITRLFSFVLLAAVLTGLPAQGQSAADLLQKGIYTQETVGDLDGAIKIYSQIVNSAAQSRAYAAQAQYRIGLCLLKKGENTEAQKAFERLIRDYPEEKELAAKAHEHLPSETKLLPTPWEENELTEYRSRMENGQDIGTTIYSIEPAPGDPHISLISIRGYAWASPYRLSRLEVEHDTLRPLKSYLKFIVLGQEYRREYREHQVEVRVGNKQPRTVIFAGQVFDNDELPFLLRRLPLGNGSKLTVSSMNPTGLLLNSPVVISEEDVQVPAGKFHCYKVELTDVSQTIWIGDGPSRPLVKYGGGNVSVELVSISKIDRRLPVLYQDAKVGVSFTAPPAWIARREEANKADETLISMLDPESKIPLMVWAKQVKTAPSEMEHELRAAVNKRIEEQSNELKDYQILPDTVKLREIGGNQGLTCVAQFLRGQEKMVEYLVWVRSENTNTLFSAFGPARDLDEFRKRLDPIVETVKLK